MTVGFTRSLDLRFFRTWVGPYFPWIKFGWVPLDRTPNPNLNWRQKRLAWALAQTDVNEKEHVENLNLRDALACFLGGEFHWCTVQFLRILWIYPTLLAFRIVLEGLLGACVREPRFKDMRVSNEHAATPASQICIYICNCLRLLNWRVHDEGNLETAHFRMQTFNGNMTLVTAYRKLWITFWLGSSTMQMPFKCLMNNLAL